MVCIPARYLVPGIPPGRTSMSASAKSGFCECCVGEHGDAVGCLDLGGFFDGYGFDVDSGAAEKVYYGEAFDVFESVGEEDVCFFAHFLGAS